MGQSAAKIYFFKNPIFLSIKYKNIGGEIMLLIIIGNYKRVYLNNEPTKRNSF